LEYLVVSDTSIVAVNCGTTRSASAGLLYRDRGGVLHTIDFETCARNCKAEHSDASQCCIGERKMDEGYFLFYTSGVKTKIVFDKLYVSNFFRHRVLSGRKTIRFLKLQQLINQSKYTTIDLS